MDDALGNNRYVIYIKKGAFAQPKKNPKVVYISKLDGVGPIDLKKKIKK